MKYDVLIVGGGHAGAQSAIALRQLGFGGSLALVSDEPSLPYERPPLSKDYLFGEKPFERILLRPESFWKEREVAFHLGERVEAVDPTKKLVQLRSGRELGYGDLIWTAGGRARRLDCEGGGLSGVHTIRTRADVDQLVAELPDVTQVAVIGAGYIGLEAAAVLTKLGKSVTVLEAQDRVLARVAGPPLSRFLEAVHRAKGVDLRLGVTVEAIEGHGRVSGVRLTSGERIAAQIAIVGIGIVPEVGPLQRAGAIGADGIDVDEHGRTSLPNVYAAGDCAAHINPYGPGRRLRIESVQNANDQATVVAKSICGQAASYQAVPWFWSNQYDVRLQTVGLATGYDGLVLRGDPDGGSFSVVYLRGGEVAALDCVNATKDYVQGKALVASRARVAEVLLADPAIALRDLAAAQPV